MIYKLETRITVNKKYPRNHLFRHKNQSTFVVVIIITRGSTKKQRHIKNKHFLLLLAHILQQQIKPQTVVVC
jgi:hypothetical protein